MKWLDWKNEAAGRCGAWTPWTCSASVVLFFMIQGHLFRAYLLPALRQQSWYKMHEVFHGFVAPGFLFVAGFAAFLSFHNKRQNYIHLDAAFFKRLRRILFVIAIGYWIHLPFLSLRKTLQFVRLGRAGDFLKVDILQCIGVGLLLFTLLAVLLKNEKVVVLLSALAGALFFLLPAAVKGIRLPSRHRSLFQLRGIHLPDLPLAGVPVRRHRGGLFLFPVEKGSILPAAAGPGHRCSSPGFFSSPASSISRPSSPSAAT